MANALVAAGRAFVKPLRYGGEELFPDFVLVDDAPYTDVEVWGRARSGELRTPQAREAGQLPHVGPYFAGVGRARSAT